jgi:hypothetical protein
MSSSPPDGRAVGGPLSARPSPAELAAVTSVPAPSSAVDVQSGPLTQVRASFLPCFLRIGSWSPTSHSEVEMLRHP